MHSSLDEHLYEINYTCDTLLLSELKSLSELLFEKKIF
jgi:hypothetical protein